MKLPSELKTYMNNIADQLGMSFQYGDSQRILNRQSARLTYPVLWLEPPTVRRAEDGAFKLILQSAFAVLYSVRPDDWDGIDTAQDNAFKLTEKILYRMEDDADLSPPTFEFDRERCVSDLITYWSGDSDTGWHTQIVVTIQGGCADSFYDGQIFGENINGMWGGGGSNVIGNE